MRRCGAQAGAVTTAPVVTVVCRGGVGWQGLARGGAAAVISSADCPVYVLAPVRPSTAVEKAAPCATMAVTSQAPTNG